jgi:hypothetical protein
MTRVLRVLGAVTCAAMLAAAAGCVATQAPPDTSPTLTTGTVGGTLHMTIVPGAAVPPVLVSVAGTMVNANISRLGDFVLANVPEGPLELRFTGDRIAAVLPAGQIAGGETVTLSVRLTPAAAVIESVSRVRGSEALVEGAIEEPGVPLPEGTLIVGGRTISVPPGTVIRGTSNGSGAGALKTGTRVRVTGTVHAAGVTAREILVL